MTAEEIRKKNIPNGIINIKAIGKGNGKPQYKAEKDVIIKCMEEYAQQEVKKAVDLAVVVGQSEQLLCDDCISDGMLETLIKENNCLSCTQKLAK